MAKSTPDLPTEKSDKKKKKKKRIPVFLRIRFCGGDYRTRTYDPLHVKQVL